jgi:hypothetical protein
MDPNDCLYPSLADAVNDLASAVLEPGVDLRLEVSLLQPSDMTTALTEAGVTNP